MTTPTDELARALREAAGDLVEQAHRPAPDTATIWKRGRRVAWTARAAAAGLVAAALLLVTTVVLVVRQGPSTLPADGSTLTYPQFVSEIFPGRYAAGPQPVFGYVMTLDPSSTRTFVIHRSGLLSAVPGAFPVAFEGTLAPDGLHVLTADGVADLSDGSLIRPNAADPLIGGDNDLGTDGRWSPDSQHVAITTENGPAVIDLRANMTTPPLDDEDDDLIAVAGWRDAETLVGVRSIGSDASPALEVVSRARSAQRWTAESRIDLAQQARPGAPSFVHASPDGSRLLLRFPNQSGSIIGSAVLVDARSGQPVPLTDDGSTATTEWDACPPVWQENLPLRSSGGLHRPGDSSAVLEFSGRLDLGCVSLAGAELTGAPDPRSVLVLRERVWRVALPIGAVIALVGAAWVTLALRRSRRNERPGKRWLPMIYVPHT